MEKRQYEETLPKLQASNIDIVSLECHNAREPMHLIELICGKLSALRAGRRWCAGSWGPDAVQTRSRSATHG